MPTAPPPGFVMPTHVSGISVAPPPELVKHMMTNFKPTSEDATQSCTVYVGNLNPMISTEQLYQFFQASIGGVINARVATEREIQMAFRIVTAMTTTFAFVQFVDQDKANTALTLSGMTLGDRAIRVNPAQNPQRPPPEEVQDPAALDRAKVCTPMVPVCA